MIIIVSVGKQLTANVLRQQASSNSKFQRALLEDGQEPSGKHRETVVELVLSPAVHRRNSALKLSDKKTRRTTCREDQKTRGEALDDRQCNKDILRISAPSNRAGKSCRRRPITILPPTSRALLMPVTGLKRYIYQVVTCFPLCVSCSHRVCIS